MYQTYAFLMDRDTVCLGRATPVTKKTRTVLSVLLVWSEWRDLLAARLAFGNARGEIVIASSSIASLFVLGEPLL